MRKSPAGHTWVDTLIRVLSSLALMTGLFIARAVLRRRGKLA